MEDSMRPRFQTYWNVEVQVWNDGRRGTAMATGDSTLEKALARGITDASYYCLSCGYNDITIELTESCAQCHNVGTIVVLGPTGRAKTVRCPACHGNIATGHVEPFPFLLHENAVADLAAAR
jgi:hypothetical protein